MTAVSETGGVGTDSYWNRKLKPAFSSQRCTRPPAKSTASESTYSRAGCGGASLMTVAGVSGAPVSSTRKNLALVSGNANVRTVPPR